MTWWGHYGGRYEMCWGRSLSHARLFQDWCPKRQTLTPQNLLHSPQALSEEGLRDKNRIERHTSDFYINVVKTMNIILWFSSFCIQLIRISVSSVAFSLMYHLLTWFSAPVTDCEGVRVWVMMAVHWLSPASCRRKHP